MGDKRSKKMRLLRALMLLTIAQARNIPEPAETSLILSHSEVTSHSNAHKTLLGPNLSTDRSAIQSLLQLQQVISQVYETSATSHVPLPNGSPARPTPANQFTASVSISAPGSLNNTTSIVYYDSVAGEQLSTYSVVLDLGNKFKPMLNESVYANATDGYLLLNGVCRSYPLAKFHDQWQWLAAATYHGNQTINGRACTVWYLTSPQYNLTLFADGNMPVRLVTEYDIPPLPGKPPMRSRTQQDFLHFEAGKPKVSLEIPNTCLHGAPLCGTTGKDELHRTTAATSPDPTKMVAYVAHPPKLYNLTNQDVADSLGDVMFTCYDVLTNNTKIDDYGVVSLYVLEVDDRWGAYSLCNGYDPAICLGSELFYVGREASFGIKANGGQCSNNGDTGSWYSLPAAGECKKGVTVASGKCSWRVVERIKTVDMGCVFQTQDMLGACKEDGGLPYTKSKAIFEQAFLSNVASQGGCPDIPPPPALKSVTF